jgi:serine/threonine protein kinase/Tol biopolymer transport system component
VESNLVGTQLGKYEIQAEVGRGGMGVVYKGYDPTLDRYVAVKVLAPHLVWEKEFVERFLREARAAARLKHAHIVTIHDVGQAGGSYYFVMEYLEGPTLTTVIQKRGPLPPDEVLSILHALADALDHAHSRGLVHRDVKPGNVIVGPTGHVTLTDFGIVRAARETRLTATGTIVGTPEYMSPEQARGLAVGTRSDQYSLAVAAYEMLSGKVPFEAESTLALLHKIVYEPLPSIQLVNPDLPVGVQAVMKKALAKDPDDRYERVSAFVEALGQALAGEKIETTPTLVMEPGATPGPIPASERTQVMPPAVQPAGAPGPRPDRIVVPVPQPERMKVLAPDEQATIASRHRVPTWAWALGGLVVLALALAVMRGRERGGQETSTPPSATPMPTMAVAAVHATSTLRPESSSATSSLRAYLVFVSDRGGKREIYHLTEAGKEAQITRTPDDGESWSPVLAPDGTVLFTSNRDGKREIYQVAKAGEVIQVTHTPGRGESWSPVLAPDGTILFVSDRDGKPEVYHLAEEGKVIRITQTPGDDGSWSPVPALDGTILFVSNRDGKQEIYHLNEVGEVIQVTHTPGGGESWSPVLAPDGTMFFTSDRDGKREMYQFTEVGGVIQITHTPGGGESWSPVLAPDGAIFFTSDRDGKQEIYRLTEAGSIARVTHTPGGGESWLPAW